MLPGQFRQVHEAVSAAQVDEGAEAAESADAAFEHQAGLELVDQLFLAVLAVLARRRPLREDQAVAPRSTSTTLSSSFSPMR